MRDLLGDDGCLLRERSLLQLVFSAMKRTSPISVPEACDMYFSSSVPDSNVSRTAPHREQ